MSVKNMYFSLKLKSIEKNVKTTFFFTFNQLIVDENNVLFTFFHHSTFTSSL